MNKILVNEKEFNFTENDLPVLIHGESKSGASLYMVTIAANLFSQKAKLVVLCGYPMAEAEFKTQVGVDYNKDQTIFYTKEKIEEFKKELGNLNGDDKVIIIKNLELFRKDVFDLVLSKNRIILSGDINKCIPRNKILGKNFKTKILFSPLENIQLPKLEKYEGFFIAQNLEGITKVKF